LGVCWGCYLFTTFFRDFIPKKEVSKLTTPICPCSPSNLYCHILHVTILWILYSKNLGIWIQGSGAVGYVSSATSFSNLLEDKDRRLKIKLTLSLILRVNLRLRGYSIWSASLIAPHIKKTGQLFETRAPHSLDAAKEILGGHLQDEVWENSKTPLEVLGRMQYSAMKSSRACRPGHVGLSMWHASPRIREGTWPTPYICCNYSYSSETSRTW
jgi:hypothetical protein